MALLHEYFIPAFTYIRQERGQEFCTEMGVVFIKSWLKNMVDIHTCLKKEKKYFIILYKKEVGGTFDFTVIWKVQYHCIFFGLFPRFAFINQKAFNNLKLSFRALHYFHNSVEIFFVF